MKLKDLANEFVNLYKAGVTIHLVGAPGIGKSEINRDSVDMISDKIGHKLGYVEVLCTAIDAPDVLGFLVPSKREDGQPVSTYTMPNIIAKVQATGLSHGIINLEEFAQADQLTQKALAQLINDHGIGEHKLPEGWFITMSSNRAKDKSGANKMLAHIMNRVVTLEIESDLDSFMEWYERNMKHPMGGAFARARPGVIFTNEVPQHEKPYATPRSFVRAMDYLAMLAGDEPDGTPKMNLPSTPVAQEVVAGLVGDGAAAELFAFLKVANELPTLQEILDDPENAKLPDEARLDAQYAAMQLLIHHVDNNNVDKLFAYGRRLNLELQVSMVRSFISKTGGACMNSTYLSEFIAENRDLIIGSAEV